jgi:hypothetical protein
MYIERILIALLGLGSLFAGTAAYIAQRITTPLSPLQTFYVEGFSRTLEEASLFLFVLGAGLALYHYSLDFRRVVENLLTRTNKYLHTCSLSHYSIISFGASAALLFALNATGIINGTFMIDDYKMYPIAVEKSVGELFFTPINDHVIPLFWLELKALFFFIGTTPPPLNFPLYAAAVAAIGGAAILLRLLKFGPSTLFILLGTFASTSVVSHQLYGFYAVAPYFQVLAVLIFSLISFVLSQELRHLRWMYATLSLILLAASLLLESGAIWTPGAYILFIYVYHVIRSSSWDPRSFLKKYVALVSAASVIGLTYAVYLFILPHYTTESFYGFERLPISLTTVLELYHVFTAGVILSLFAPRLGLIVSQPSFASLIVLWHLGMAVLFFGIAILALYAIRNGTERARTLVPYFILMALGTSLLVAIARPSSNPAAFYRDQNILFPLFFLTLALAVFAHEWVREAADNTRRRARGMVVLFFVILIFVSQHVFSFYKDQYAGDGTFNQALVTRMRETLVPAFNELSSVSPPLIAPTLGDRFLGNSFHQLPDLSAFSTFVGIRDVTWLPLGRGSYRASTSPAFIKAMQEDSRIRTWYLVPGEVQETCFDDPFGKDVQSFTSQEVILLADSLNPSDRHLLYFDLEASNAPEKIFLDISFNNDFNASGTRAHIRIDQYTKSIDSGTRRYACVVDLNEIPAFGLSETIENLMLGTETPGEYRMRGFRIEKR